MNTLPYNHFQLNGKVYDRQVIYKDRESEVFFVNQLGKVFVRFRDDVKDEWWYAGLEELEVNEIKTKNK